MKIDAQKTPELTRLGKTIHFEPIGMLTTFDADHRVLRSRPLATLKMDADPALWFLTSVSSAKVHELDEHRDACMSYSSRGSYVSVSGIASIVREKSVIAALWTPMAKAWFPNGVEDPDLAALRLSMQSAELWDGPHNPVTQIFAVGLAATTGNTALLGEDVKVAVPGKSNGRRATGGEAPR